MECYLLGALQKELLRITPFVYTLKQLLWEGLADGFCQYLEKFT